MEGMLSVTVIDQNLHFSSLLASAQVWSLLQIGSDEQLCRDIKKQPQPARRDCMAGFKHVYISSNYDPNKRSGV